jgi:hypothetical protein
MNITISIERLIFDGIVIPQRQRTQMQNACEAELTRLLAANGLSFDFQTVGSQKTLQGGVLEVKPDETPQVLGKKLAQAIYKGIGQ